MNDTTEPAAQAAPMKQTAEPAAEWEVWGWMELARMQAHSSADVLQPSSADSRYEADTDIEGDWGDSDEELDSSEGESEVETEDENVEDDEHPLVVTIRKKRSDVGGGFHADFSACNAASAMAVVSFSP